MTEQPPSTEPTTGDETMPEAPGRRSVNGLVIAGVAAVVVVVLAGGAFAVFTKLDGGGTQPHDVLPASTQVYARLDVDPSASQKVKLLKLIRKFPDVANDVGIKSADQDVRKLIFDEAIASECPDVDYDDDVKPWLGSRIGIGGNIDDETFEIALQTTDEKKSRAGIKKLFDCTGEDFGIAYLDGYAILSDKQKTVDAAVKATRKGTLGDQQRFNDDFDALGDQGVASAWVDLTALADIPDLKGSLGADTDQLAKAGSVATTLRVDGNALELAALSQRAPDAGARSTDLGKLPADTVAALSVAGGGEQVGKAFDAFVEGMNSGFGSAFASEPTAAATLATPGPTTTPGDPTTPADPFSGGDLTDGPFGGSFDVQDFIDEIERETGFKLPDDLETLLGDNLTLAIGAKNLQSLPALSGPDDVGALDVALSLTTDRAKALDLVQRIAALAEQAGIPLVTAPTDSGAVLATNQGAADAIVKPSGKLGDEAAFKEVIPDSDTSSGGLFVDIGTIVDKLQQADPPEDQAKDLEEAEKLSAFGLSVGEDDGHSLFSIRLSFTK